MSLLDADVKYNKDGEPDGRWRARYDNGSICAESNYKDGVKDGLFIWWYENGQKKLQECYKDGELVGITTMWHENGYKKSEVNFDNGIKDRVYTWFDENGKKKERGTHKDGELILKECWDSKGKKIKCEDGVENSTIERKPISNELKNAFKIRARTNAIEDLVKSKGIASLDELFTGFKMLSSNPSIRPSNDIPLYELSHTNEMLLEVIVSLLLRKKVFSKEEYDKSTNDNRIYLGSEPKAIDIIRTDTVKLEVLNNLFIGLGYYSIQEFEEEAIIIKSTDYTGRWDKRTS
jgi:hypothetical protein